MIANEYLFQHLREAEEQRFRQELEYRRIARERGVDRESAATHFGHVVRDTVRRLRRPAHTGASVLSPSR
ncbi:hypothetical protein [Microbacterium deminutum]|uniref:Uncharacterized protein n=1 Tax=Microbacterium deminutum TaxID=344164 RepID=A0ABP5BG17_9MICO